MAKNELIARWSWAAHMARPVEEALSELEREAQVRSRCFDRWVAEGRVSYIDARDRQERLLSAIRLLREHQDLTEQLAREQAKNVPPVTDGDAGPAIEDQEYDNYTPPEEPSRIPDANGHRVALPGSAADRESRDAF